ncbi:MAG: NADH-quinone oxidoreductase subunit L [Phycisphaeraceae bacterium]
MTGTQGFIRLLIVLAVLLPLFSSVLVLFFGKRRLPGEKSGWFTTVVMGVSCAFSLIALMLYFSVIDLGAITWKVPWIPIPGTEAGWLYLGVLIDGLTVAMMFMVTLISTLVHVYSIGYMHGDKRFERFFAYLSMFTFSMMGIVVANSIMQLFVFWELVGLTSYLLIGFWFEKRGPQLACKKAFVMNRIGDAGFLIGFGILFWKLGANVLLPGGEVIGAAAGSPEPVAGMFGAIRQIIESEGHSFTNPPMWLTMAGIGLFFGAIGKSAQFPLHTWLPDAMEGPTPVSSIVHSATMVAAGVFLTARIYPILTPGAHLFISTIGLITLVMAAFMALVMTDIKRVLAYSTLSQLGYMILGLGTGNYIFAVYHMITHAFFKCCLFQCAGSVIHAAHHQQDMRYYGGLKDKMPKTALCYAVCTLAISGAVIPFTPIGISGFYSKDGIIAGAYNYGSVMGSLFYWGPTIIAYVTAFYMARSFALTFLGKPRDQHLYDNAHEAPSTMVVPQLVLAAMAVISVPLFPLWRPMIENAFTGMAGLMQAAQGTTWAQSLDEVAGDASHGMHFTHLVLLYGFGWILAIGAGIWFYKDGLERAERVVRIPGIGHLHHWARNKFYFDALYDIFAVNLGKVVAGVASLFDKIVVDGLVNLAGTVTKLFAAISGKVDSKIVDGAVNGAADFAYNSGSMLRSSQAGRVRVYVTVVIVAAALVTLAVIAVTLVTQAA